MLSSAVNEYFEKAYEFSCIPQPYDRKGEGSAEDKSLLTWVKFELFMANQKIVSINFYLFGCPYTMALSGVILAQSLDSGLYTAGREYYRQLLEPLELPRALAGKVIIVEDAFYAALDELRRGIN
jgi:hypothetical protein